MYNKLGIAITDKCNAACEMCCFGCSPRGKHVLSGELIRDVIRQASEMGNIKALGFTGGEAFLYFDRMLECSTYAKSLGLEVSINTNGFWGRDEKRALEMLRALKDAGVGIICFSADRYHQQYVPLEHLRAAIRLTHAVGMAAEVNIMETAHSDDIVRMTEALRPEIYHAAVSHHPMMPVGKALENIKDGEFVDYVESKDAACPMDGLIPVGFDGNYYMCCSQFCMEIPRLNLGNAGEVALKDAIKRVASDDYLYVMLRKGFGWYVDQARALGYDIPERVCTPCHCCYLIFHNQKLLDDMRDRVEEEAGRLRIQHLLGT